MTRAVVDPSVCGLTPVKQVARLAAHSVRVIHGTHCETVDGINVEPENLNLGLALKSLGDSFSDHKTPAGSVSRSFNYGK